MLPEGNMPARPIRDRLIPYKILGYILYSPQEHVEWLENVSDDEIVVSTGTLARALRIQIRRLWDVFRWLEFQKLVIKVSPGEKRGIAIIKLKQPTNIKDYGKKDK